MAPPPQWERNSSSNTGAAAAMDEPQIDELKELVKISLQQAGILGSIKAQLRAEVFKVVNSEQGAAGEPRAALAAMATTEGQVTRARGTHRCERVSVCVRPGGQARC